MLSIIFSPKKKKACRTGFCLVLLFSTFCLQPALTNAQSILDSARIIPVPTARPEGGISGKPAFLPSPAGSDRFSKTKTLLRLHARVGESETLLEKGLVWRIYNDEPGLDGKLDLLSTSAGGSMDFTLQSGYYLVHVSFGYAGVTKRIKVTPPETEISFNLNAGGLRLNAAFREGDIIPSKFLTFQIAHEDDGTLKPIATDVKADELIRLTQGTYHVTSRYGTINSEISAEVRVKSGQMTDLTLYQRGAEITLKLVNELGGEALANTSWTVLTPGGDPVVSTIASAFPSLVLAAGDYLAYAHHENETYSAKFIIESGVHRDVEVMLGQKE